MYFILTLIQMCVIKIIRILFWMNPILRPGFSLSCLTLIGFCCLFLLGMMAPHPPGLLAPGFSPMDTEKASHIEHPDTDHEFHPVQLMAGNIALGIISENPGGSLLFHSFQQAPQLPPPRTA